MARIYVSRRFSSRTESSDTKFEYPPRTHASLFKLVYLCFSLMQLHVFTPPDILHWNVAPGQTPAMAAQESNWPFTPATIQIFQQLQHDPGNSTPTPQKPFADSNADTTRLHQLENSTKDRNEEYYYIAQLSTIICLPILAFGIFLSSVCNNTPSWLEHCTPEEISIATESACYFKEVVEKPTVFLHVPLLLATHYTLKEHLKALAQLKKYTLALTFLTTTLIRCLSSFSGWTTQRTEQPGQRIWKHNHIWLWSSSSPGKLAWLWFLIASGPWVWTYLGTYGDAYWDEAAQCIKDEDGRDVWRADRMSGIVAKIHWVS